MAGPRPANGVPGSCSEAAAGRCGVGAAPSLTKVWVCSLTSRLSSTPALGHQPEQVVVAAEEDVQSHLRRTAGPSAARRQRGA